LPKDADMIPLPKDDVTPPVTNRYFAGDLLKGTVVFVFAKILFVTDYSFFEKSFIKSF
jgi:hypothetical protein